MRGCKIETITTAEGKVLGICFNGAYCAEHEWGIEDLKKCLGIDTDKLGVDRRTSTTHKNSEGGKDWFWIGRHNENKTKAQLKDLYEMGHPREGAASGWDGGSVGIWLDDKAPAEVREAVAAISKAIEADKPLVVMLSGSSSPFGRSGLLVCTREAVDAVPSINEQLTASDKAALTLKEAWQPVEQMLKQELKSCKVTPYIKEWLEEQHTKYPYSYPVTDTLDLSHPCYMAPKELLSQPPEGSKYPFLIWLNPNEQDLCDYGWYTVEQLLMLKDGGGPVIENGTVYGRFTARDAILRGEKAYPCDYEAICAKCGHVHHNGNAQGRKEMLTHHKDSHGYDKLVACPKCGAAGDTFVFSDDNPEHYRNTKYRTETADA